jgi:hypothetical protein
MSVGVMKDSKLKLRYLSSTRLGDTGFRGGLEPKDRDEVIIDERFPSVMGECVI